MRDNLTMEDLLKQEGVLVSTTVGVSMEPLFRDRRDTIVIRPVTGRLKKYDVPLYRRGEAYVLHRIIKVLPDSYVICGDNCVTKEYGITDGDIVGVLTEFYRKDRHVTVDDPRYRLYARIWCAGYPLRVAWSRVRAFAARRIRRVFPKN